MLQRIFGTAWATKKELKTYLHRIEEAEKRDHRRLAKQLDPFHFQEESPGMVFWHDNGWRIYTLIMQYMHEQYGVRERAGLLGSRVSRPLLIEGTNRSRRPGHWAWSSRLVGQAWRVAP